jgi:hypothetical protein
MTETLKVAIVVALGPTIVGVYNSYQSNKIHTLVNSNLTNIKNKLETALSRVIVLEGIIKDMTQKKGD